MTLEFFKCDICAKSYDTRGKLNRHLKTHSKPFQCGTCPSSFALRLDRERHIKARHSVGNVQYRCDVKRCSFKSNRKDNLDRHIKRFHTRTVLPAKNDTSIIDATIEASFSESVALPSAVNNFNGFGSVSMFMQAASLGDITTLELLINSGFTTETEADDRSTALHCAARNGRSRTVRYLLGKGASSYALNEKGRLPLHEAFLSSDIDTVGVLIEQIPVEQLERRKLENEYCLARANNIRVFELYVQHSKVGFGADNTNRIFRNALCARNDSLAAALLGHPDTLINGCDRRLAPILDAARYGNAKTMELLLASSRVNKAPTTKVYNWNALHLASLNGHPDIVEQLLHLNFDVESSDGCRRTPLQLAAMRGHVEVVKLLVEKWKANISSSDLYGYTTLHQAAFGGHWKCVHVLFGYIASGNHRNVLDIQFENKDFVKKDVVTHLLNTAAFEDSNIRCRYRMGNTLLHCVVQKGDIEAIEVLMAHDKIEVNAKNYWDRSPLIMAVEHRRIEAARSLLQHPEIDVNLKTRNGKMALNYARAFGYQEMVDLLLSHGAKYDEAGNAPTITMEDSSSLATVKAGQIPNTPLPRQHEIEPEFDFDTLTDGIPALDDNSNAEDETGIF